MSFANDLRASFASHDSWTSKKTFSFAGSAPDATASEQQWHDTVASYRHDLDRVETFVRDTGLDLYTAASHVWEAAHTPLRTVLVMADHAAYHGGELGILRQVMGLWTPDRIDHFTVDATVTQNVQPETNF